MKLHENLPDFEQNGSFDQDLLPAYTHTIYQIKANKHGNMYSKYELDQTNSTNVITRNMNFPKLVKWSANVDGFCPK